MGKVHRFDRPSQDPPDVGPLLPSAELMGELWGRSGRNVQTMLRRALPSWPGCPRQKMRLAAAALAGASRARGGRR